MYVQSRPLAYPYGQRALDPMAASIPTQKYAGVAAGVVPGAASASLASALAGSKSTKILGLPLIAWGAIAAGWMFLGGRRGR